MRGRREKHQKAQFFDDVREPMLLPRGNMQMRAPGMASRRSCPASKVARPETTCRPRLPGEGLMVPGAGGQDVSRRQARNTEELEPGLTRRPLTLRSFSKSKEVHCILTKPGTA
jgi:hypothetical protein